MFSSRRGTLQQRAAEKATQRVRQALSIKDTTLSVSCAYQGPETEEDETNLHCMMRVRYVWSAPGGSIDHWVLAGRALHAGGYRCILWALQRPLLASGLPAAITERQLVPAMRGNKDAVCRAVAIPKHFESEYTTTFVAVHGRMVEHIMCAPVSDSSWFVHPGGTLDHNLLTKQNVRRRAKRKRCSEPPVMLGEIKYPCALNKLMAVAFFRAEVERAASEGREVDFARSDVNMEKNPFLWDCTPKTVLALWSSSSDGHVAHDVDEIPCPRMRL